MRTPQIVLSPIGQAFPAISIPGVGQIRSVLIDNPSGSWLLLRPTNDYIPPYTIGWVRSFIGGVASVDIVYEAPSGQVSTLQGDPAIVVLDTEIVADSAGSSSGAGFISQFTPVQRAVFSQTITQSASVTGTLIAAVPGKRIRILTIDVTKTSTTRDGSITYGFIENGVPLQNVVSGVVDTANPSREHVYSSGIDLAIGSSLTYSFTAAWSSLACFAIATYQLI